MDSASGNAAVPELVLGAGGKAPGFVQQMLFSAPVQEKNAKGMHGDFFLFFKRKKDRRWFKFADGGYRTNKSEYQCVVGR